MPRRQLLLLTIALHVATGCNDGTIPGSKGASAVKKPASPNSGAESGQASRDRGFNLVSPFENVSTLAQRKISLGYTGTDFAGSCGDNSPIFLPEIYTQKFILNPYSQGKDLFSQLIASWEATDPERIKAPATPAHPMIRQRLGSGTNPDMWMLNLIRFRSDHIKMNYELPLLAAGSTEHWSLRHSFTLSKFHPAGSRNTRTT